MSDLQTVMELVDQLTPEDQEHLLVYLERSVSIVRPELSLEERIHRLDKAARAIREGFTDEEWASIEHDMNSEYIEVVDDALWTD